jgi:hypothetical protein
VKALVRRALEIASTQINVTETPGRPNQGPQVNAYLRSTGLGPGNPWCAAYVYWCIEQAATQMEVDNPFIRTAWCPAMDAWAKAHDILEQRPEVGDVFLLYGQAAGSLARHTGFVTRVDGAKFGANEGNTNLGGSPEGIGVFLRERTNSGMYRFIRWNTVAGETRESTSFTLHLENRPVLKMQVRDGRALCPIRKWGETLGLKVEWNQADQVALLDGQEVNTQVVVIGNSAFAPIRDLVTAAGMRLRVDEHARKVFVFK